VFLADVKITFPAISQSPHVQNFFFRKFAMPRHMATMTHPVRRILCGCNPAQIGVVIVDWITVPMGALVRGGWLWPKERGQNQTVSIEVYASTVDINFVFSISSLINPAFQNFPGQQVGFIFQQPKVTTFRHLIIRNN